jgi:hypothetical protein
MAAKPPEAGPYRKGDELSFLTPDMILPLNPTELVQQYTADQLLGRAMGENAITEGLTRQADELREQLSVLIARIEHARTRAAAYTDAYHIARGNENSS